jgi:tRNA pseudouridine38-40 synthase
MSTGTGGSVRPSSVLYKSIVAYDGTAYEGFQRQTAGVATIQAALESALTEIGWQERSILAAGRTDRGVHASGQVISYNLSWGHETENLTQALNAYLPSDIAIRETEVAPPDFHPRYAATSRRYRYSFFVDGLRDPLRSRYAMRLYQEPDVERMRAAAGMLVGERDFRVFGPSPRPEGTTVREIIEASLSVREDEIHFEIEANAFLQHMVRRIAAALSEVGKKNLALDQFENLLHDPTARWEGKLALPGGLCLLKVTYP